MIKYTFEYSSLYRKPKELAKQVRVLRSLFPQLVGCNYVLGSRELPVGAEGSFAIPKWQTIAPTYGEAVEKVFAKISETRKGKFKNWREGELGPDYLKQSARAEKMFQTLGDEQKDHDILVVAAQFGLRHRGRSVRRAREVMQVNEYGLGAFAVGIMLLTHPERLMNYDDLYVQCAGDQCVPGISNGFAPGAGPGFLYTPGFRFGEGRLNFAIRWFADADGYCGSASAFLPQ